MSTFNLRNQNDALPETFNLGSRGLHDAYRTMPMAGAGEVRRGWESSGLGLRANELLSASNLAEIQGDTMRAATLRQQAEDLRTQASAWAPRVQDMTDISSFGDAVDWAGGQLGNLRSSVAPMVGGVVGAGLGGAVGLLARNPALGAKVGGAIGSFSQAFPMMRDESIGEAMMDPEIARTRTAQEIRDTGNLVGVGSGVFESVVPMGIGSGIATLGRKALTNELAGRGAARVIGGAVAKEGAEEFLTEGTQNLAGQAGQNYLRRDDLTDFDYKEALNAAAGGAIGGGVMGGGGKLIEVGGNKLFSGTQAGADKVREIATNPMQKAGDFIADTGAKLGEMVGKRDGAMSDEQMQRSAEKIAERLSQPDVSDADRASALEMIRSGKFMEDDNPFTLTQDDGDVTTDQGKLQADRNVAARAAAHADKILNPDYRRDFSEDERLAAARYKAGQTDYNQFRAELESAKAAKRAKRDEDEFNRAMGFDPDEDVKYSRMRTRPNYGVDLADPDGYRRMGPSEEERAAWEENYLAMSPEEREKIPDDERAYYRTRSKAPARTQPTNVSTTHYIVDLGEPANPEVARTDASENKFNYDSLQRSAGVQRAKEVVSRENPVGPPQYQGDPTKANWDTAQRSGSSTGKRNYVITAIHKWARKKSSEEAEAVKQAAEKSYTVAQALVNGGYYPKEVVDVAKSSTERESLLNRASDLIMWARAGFISGVPENPMAVPDYLIEKYGADVALKLLDVTYQEGVKSGLVPRKDAQFSQMRKYVEQRAVGDKMVGDAILSNIAPQYRAEASKRMGEVIKELRMLFYSGNLDQTLVKDRGTGARARNPKQDAFVELFPTPEQQRAVLEAFDKAYGSHVAGVGYGGSTTDPVIRSGGNVSGDGASRATVKSDEDYGDSRYGEFSKERGFEESAEESGNEAAPRSVSKYINRKYDQQFVTVFDTQNETDKARLEETYQRELGAKAEGGGRHRVERVGVVDRALDEAEVKANGPLTEAEREQVMEEVVTKYRKDLVRPTEPPASASNLAKKMYERELSRYKREVVKAAAQLNKRYQSVRRVDVASERLQGEIDIQAIRANQLNRRLDHPDNHPMNGVLGFKTEKGGVMLMSAPQIMRLMFKQANNFGDPGAVYGGKDDDGSPISIEPGKIVRTGELLMEGIAAIMQHGQYQSVGYVHNGKVVPISRGLPDNFKIMSVPAKKRGEPRESLTWGDYKAAVKDYRGRVDEAEVSKDHDPDTFDQRREAVEKSDAEVASNIWAVKKLQKRIDAGEKVPMGERAQLRRYQELSKEDKGRFNNFFARWYDKDDGSAFRATPGARRALKAWAELLGVPFDIIEFNDGKGADGLDGSDRQVSGLEAYSPSKTIHRDDTGIMNTMGEDSPQSVVGRSQPVKPEDVRKFDPATMSEKFGSLSVVTPELRNIIDYLFKDTNLGVRSLDHAESNKVKAAIMELVRRAAPVRQPGESATSFQKRTSKMRNPFAAHVAAIAHFYGFGATRKITDDMGDRVTVGASEHTALYQGDLGEGLGGIIGLNTNVFTELRKHLFTDIPSQIRYVIAHEVGHSVDIGADKKNPGDYSTDPVFKMGEGAVAREMEAAALSDTNPFRKLLRHTPFKKEYEGRPVAAQRELFAQAYAIYLVRKDEMREHLPITYAYMEKLNEQWTNPVRQSARADRRSAEVGQDRRASVEKGNNPGGSDQAGVQGAGGRPVRNEPADEGRAGPADELQAYLDQHGRKNAVWANASRKALASGDQKQVAGALAAARKQFGELSTPSETRADTGATTPASGPGSMSQPHTIPMNYKIWNSSDIRPELRKKYKAGSGIADLIAAGDRTATTRTPPAGVKVGHIIRFPGVDGLYRVTGFEKVDLSTPAGREKWSKREGWDVSMTGSFGSQVRTGATQMLFERVDSKSVRDSLETRADTGSTTTTTASETLEASDSQTAKRDAFVFKIANMSMKDMRTYVDSIPFDKLQRVWDALDTFYPVDIKNPFWQRHGLDTYSEKQDKMVQAALYRIEDRLAEESDAGTDSDTKFSRQRSRTTDGKIKAVAISRVNTVVYNKSVVDNLSEREKFALDLHEIGVHLGLKKMIGAKKFDEILSRLQDLRGKSKMVDEAYNSVPIDTDPMDINEEALAYLVENYHNMPLVKRVIEAVKEWFKARFGKAPSYEKQMYDLAVASLRRNGPGAIRKTVDDIVSGKSKPGFERMEFNKTLDRSPLAKKILDKITDALGDKALIAGSLAIAPQREIYRKSDAGVHDLDFSTPLTVDALRTIIPRVLPGAVPLREIESKDGSYVTFSFVVPADGVKITSIKFMPKGKFLATAITADGRATTLTEENSIVVDFFTGMKTMLGPVQRYTGADGKVREAYLSHAKHAFDAKTSWLREKDVTDIVDGDVGTAKFSRMENNQSQTETAATPEQVKAAEAFLTKALGDSIDTLLAENLDPDVSGFWKQRDTKNLIEIGRAHV